MTKEKQFINKIASYEIGSIPNVVVFEELIKEARKLQSKSTIHPEATDVLDYLNKLAKRRFSARRSNLIYINARLQEGITVQQLKQVIELKVFQWANDYTMKAHLNPETLFRPSKIEKYLQEVEDIEKNPQKFKQHVERNHQEEQRQRDRNFNPLAD
ncbi:conserved phage C-terminal domain-containing protein [Empedobacter falsenii]|uniref:conserved phage C-terminal domain-containing protein n=1 Tax=Empedobacter falsenii TaxID=343874 RepID=UPI0025769288|nr:conserved phage C-terminal domain-containing protein [Empedobacter falsenii]MDM1548731.1 conserved phage C-terminal domain-containing protein [Empedobacter falsenii]